jgi:hypothetical protein
MIKHQIGINLGGITWYCHSVRRILYRYPAKKEKQDCFSWLVYLSLPKPQKVTKGSYPE